MTNRFCRFAMFSLIAMSACGGTGYSYKSSADSVAQSSAPGALLVLAPEADKWSEPKTYVVKGAPLAVQSKFLKHKGTTCEFEIKITNESDSPVSASFALFKEDSRKEADGRVSLREHRFGSIDLEAGKARVWEMEVRECALHFGSTTDMKACAECRPLIGFL